jgi:hypothetical protein
VLNVPMGRVTAINTTITAQRTIFNFPATY